MQRIWYMLNLRPCRRITAPTCCEPACLALAWANTFLET